MNFYLQAPRPPRPPPAAAVVALTVGPVFFI